MFLKAPKPTVPVSHDSGFCKKPSTQTHLQTKDLPELLTPAMAAQYLHVSEQTIRNWSKLPENPLPLIRIQDTYRCRRETLLAWVTAHETPAPRRSILEPRRE